METNIKKIKRWMRHLETAVASFMGTAVKRSFQDPMTHPVDPFRPCGGGGTGVGTRSEGVGSKIHEWAGRVECLSG